MQHLFLLTVHVCQTNLVFVLLLLLRIVVLLAYHGLRFISCNGRLFFSSKIHRTYIRFKQILPVYLEAIFSSAFMYIFFSPQISQDLSHFFLVNFQVVFTCRMQCWEKQDDPEPHSHHNNYSN